MQLSCLDVKLGEEGAGGEGWTVAELIMNTLIIVLVRAEIHLFTPKHFWKSKFQVTSSRHLKINAEKLNARHRSVQITSQSGCSNHYLVYQKKKKKKKPPSQYKAKGSKSWPGPRNTTIIILT